MTSDAPSQESLVRALKDNQECRAMAEACKDLPRAQRHLSETQRIVKLLSSLYPDWNKPIPKK